MLWYNVSFCNSQLATRNLQLATRNLQLATRTLPCPVLYTYYQEPINLHRYVCPNVYANALLRTRIYARENINTYLAYKVFIWNRPFWPWSDATYSSYKLFDNLYGSSWFFLEIISRQQKLSQQGKSCGQLLLQPPIMFWHFLNEK